MKTFRQYVTEQKNRDEKRIKKETEKRHKEGNARASAFRKLYDKLGYKGNPGDHDLDE